MFFRWGLVVLGLTAAVAIVSSGSMAANAQAVQPHVFDLASKAGVTQYLQAHGIKAKTVIVQRGSHNYAGPAPACPGVGWTCAMTAPGRVILQVAKKNDDNKFFCTPSDTGSANPPNQCTIVQMSAGGNNDARCSEQSSDTTGITQECTIIQSNTTGDNHLEIQQQVDGHGGSSQAADQDAETSQDNGSGRNFAHVDQNVNLDTNDSGGGGSQTQNGHQTVSVSQDSSTGDNAADVHQSLAEHAEARGNVNVVNQNQDTDGQLNTQAAIYQDSVSGKNDAHLDQSNDLHLNASGKATGTQTQGSSSGGLLGHFHQSTSVPGVSTVHGTQHEHQDISGNPNTIQNQYGPAWFGSDQTGDPNKDTYNIDQHSDQHSGKKTNSFQSDQEFANCDTDGVCRATEQIDQNDNHQQNSCTGQSCHLGISCTSGSEGGCNPVGDCDGDCGDVPSPPPPLDCGELESCGPPSTCEIDCLTAPSNGG